MTAECRPRKFCNAGMTIRCVARILRHPRYHSASIMDGDWYRTQDRAQAEGAHRRYPGWEVMMVDRWQERSARSSHRAQRLECVVLPRACADGLGSFSTSNKGNLRVLSRAVRTVARAVSVRHVFSCFERLPLVPAGHAFQRAVGLAALDDVLHPHEAHYPAAGTRRFSWHGATDGRSYDCGNQGIPRLARGQSPYVIAALH